MNQPLELPDERLIAQTNQVLRYILRDDPQRLAELKKEFLFVNCTYDKTLTAYDDEFGSGQIILTDRQKLTRLLSVMNNAREKPKLVIIDLLFLEALPDDSLFTKELARMDNLVMGWDRELDEIEVPASVKKAQANYYTASGTFFKYPVLTDSGEYLPAALYHYAENKKGTLTRLGFVNMENELWLNSFIVDIEMRIRHLMDNRLVYLNLGETLTNFSTEEIVEATKGKIIIIGDVIINDIFTNDRHDTVLGAQPGPMLVANTYLSMVKGQARITWDGSMLLFIFYYIMTWRIMSMSTEAISSSKVATPRIVRFLLKYVSYLVIFSVFSIVLYQVLGKHFQILLFAFYLNAIEFLIKRYEGVRVRLNRWAF